MCEELVRSEREVYPPYSHLRIRTLRRFVKLLALCGEGATARCENRKEELAVLKRVNYGEGKEDSVTEEDMLITDAEASMAARRTSKRSW